MMRRRAIGMALCFAILAGFFVARRSRAEIPPSTAGKQPLVSPDHAPGSGTTPSQAAAPSPRRRVTQISAGGLHTCVLFEDGGVRCWGDNTHGALGHGDKRNIGDDEPASATGDVRIGEPATFITTGLFSTCAILKGGRLRCWGYGKFGSLGYGNKNDIGDDETPDSAGDVPVGEPVSHVSTGSGPTCAILREGRLRCWGAYALGNHLKCLDSSVFCGNRDLENRGIGYKTWRPIGDDETPASVGDLPVAGAGKPVRVACGSQHICLLFDDGGVRCWGMEAADGYLADRPDTAPSQSAGYITVGGKAKEVTVGDDFTCALLLNGRVRCWGSGEAGTLGYGNSKQVAFPKRAGDISLGGPAVHISSGDSHTCALMNAGRVRCWGKNDAGQLGYGHTRNIGDNETPASAGDVRVGGRVTQISAGGSHTCALLDTGNVRCWGANQFGQLGYGHTRNIGDDETPASAGDVPLQ